MNRPAFALQLDHGVADARNRTPQLLDAQAGPVVLDEVRVSRPTVGRRSMARRYACAGEGKSGVSLRSCLGPSGLVGHARAELGACADAALAIDARGMR